MVFVKSIPAPSDRYQMGKKSILSARRLFHPSSLFSLTLASSAVFIHGLNGHAQRTFTHPETYAYWPQDLIPEKVPTARVLIYGYSSTTKNISEGQNVLDIGPGTVWHLGLDAIRLMSVVKALNGFFEFTE